MVNFQLDRESIKLAEPVTLNCKFRVDPELVLACQRAGTPLYKGVPIGKLSLFYPIADLRRLAMEEAQTFVGHMKRQGFEPQEAESQMKLYGPYREKLDMSRGASLENFEEGNHLIPEGMWRSAATGAGPATMRGLQVLDRDRVLDSPDWKRGAAYIIQGRFLASWGKEEESTGVLIV